MKHLPVPEEPPQEPEKSTPPTDSAYSSGSDNKFSKKEEKVRPESILAPLPTKFDTSKSSAPLASAERGRPTTQTQQMLMQDGAMSVRSLASTSKSRGKSVKSLFQRTWRRGKMLAA
jgi:hypothetical protein